MCVEWEVNEVDGQMYGSNIRDYIFNGDGNGKKEQEKTWDKLKLLIAMENNKNMWAHNC
jgi:hypothetical protein